MSIEKTKDVTIGTRRFQISRFSAETGSWIAYKVMTSILPAYMGMSGISPSPGAGGNELSEADFRSIQGYCLRSCCEYQTVGDVAAAVPIVMADGRFADPELSADLPTVMGLTTHALMFNLAPLFTGDAMKTAFVGLQSLVPKSGTAA